MAEEEKDDEGAAKATGGGAGRLKALLTPQLILIGVNATLTLAAIGAVVYTKLMFQRPAITESDEFKKKQEELKKVPEPKDRPQVKFEQIIVNIAMTSGKAHYATVAFSVECRDPDVASTVTAKK